jgi:hypothetical protein
MTTNTKIVHNHTPDLVGTNVKEFYAWAIERDPNIRPLLDDADSLYERFCIITDRLHLDPPHIESPILFAIAKIKTQYELQNNGKSTPSF